MQDQAVIGGGHPGRTETHLEFSARRCRGTATQLPPSSRCSPAIPWRPRLHLRHGYESLSRMGEKGFLSITAALLARAIVAQGEKRYAEADDLIQISQEAAEGEDPSAQILCQGLSARIRADRGRHAEQRNSHPPR